MSARDVFNKLRHLDAYPKTLEEFRVKTFAGATVTLLSGLFIIVLFLSELRDYLKVETKQVGPLGRRIVLLLLLIFVNCRG